MPPLLSLWRSGTFPRGYKFQGTLKEIGEQKVMQSLKLTRIDLLSLRSCLVVARMAPQAGKAFNSRPTYCDVDKVAAAYKREQFSWKTWRIWCDGLSFYDTCRVSS